jgi:UDP-glucose 4-epimerase
VQEHPKLRHVCADLRDPAARRALEGVDVLWHLGFQLWRDHRDPGSRRAAEANRTGTANVLAAGPGHVVLASSASVYGAWAGNPLPIPETHPPRPNPECPYAGQKLEAERLCAGAAPWAALRISAVLGPHADPMVRRAAMGYRRVVPAIRGAPQAVQFLHEDDAAEALHRAGSARVTGVVNVATPDWLTEADVSRLTGGRVLRLPRRLMLSLAEAAWRARLVGFGADRAVLISGPLALDWRLASGVLGWTASRGSAPVLAEFVTEAGQTRRS